MLSLFVPREMRGRGAAYQTVHVEWGKFIYGFCLFLHIAAIK